MTPVQELAKALAHAVDIGQRIPCAGPDANHWTSDRETERHTAAKQCRHCPTHLWRACAQVGAGEQHHVWAGIDRTGMKPSTDRYIT